MRQNCTSPTPLAVGVAALPSPTAIGSQADDEHQQPQTSELRRLLPLPTSDASSPVLMVPPVFPPQPVIRSSDPYHEIEQLFCDMAIACNSPAQFIRDGTIDDHGSYAGHYLEVSRVLMQHRQKEQAVAAYAQAQEELEEVVSVMPAYLIIVTHEVVYGLLEEFVSAASTTMTPVYESFVCYLAQLARKCRVTHVVFQLSVMLQRRPEILPFLADRILSIINSGSDLYTNYCRLGPLRSLPSSNRRYTMIYYEPLSEQQRQQSAKSEWYGRLEVIEGFPPSTETMDDVETEDRVGVVQYRCPPFHPKRPGTSHIESCNLGWQALTDLFRDGLLHLAKDFPSIFTQLVAYTRIPSEASVGYVEEINHSFNELTRHWADRKFNLLSS